MVIQNLVRSAQAAEAAECRNPVDLAGILDPSVHVATWRRAVDPSIVALLERPDCRIGEHARFVGPNAELHAERALADLVPEAARLADPAGARALAGDVAELCEMFSELVCAEELLVSLETPSDAMCPRFHVDRIGIRMLVTYLGPGTEWLPNAHVDRSRLGRAGQGLPDDQNGLMRPGAEVQRVAPFDVVLLKGEAWPGAEGFGAVHRSPDPAGQRRVLLRVDMLSQRAVDGSED